MDPIMHDAEALARALEARSALGEAAAEGLGPELRQALAAAEDLERLRGPLVGGPRPSFVQALEAQLRADLRTGIGRAAPRQALPLAGRSLLAGVLLLALGLLLGRLLPIGLQADRASDRSPAGQVPAAVPSSGDGDRAADPAPEGLRPERGALPRRLPFLTLYPLAARSASGQPAQAPAVPARTTDRSGDRSAVLPGRARPPLQAAADRPAPSAPAEPAQAQAPQPADQGGAAPQSAAPVEEPEEDPDEGPAVAPSAPTEAPPPPERTPDADPES